MWCGERLRDSRTQVCMNRCKRKSSYDVFQMLIIDGMHMFMLYQEQTKMFLIYDLL